MQNFAATCWNRRGAVEHGRALSLHPRDEWVKQIEPKLLKACEFMLKWPSATNAMTCGQSYGLMEGSCRPEDPSFVHAEWLLYLGMSGWPRCSRTQILRRRGMATRGGRFKADIRRLSRSPWQVAGDPSRRRHLVSTAPPWWSTVATFSLADGGKWFTHGSVVSRDSLLGPFTWPSRSFGPEGAGPDFC